MVPALGVHSHFSLLAGTGSPAGLCRAAAAMGYTHLALTDSGNLYGLWDLVTACRETGITPIIGAETGVWPDRLFFFVTSVTGYRNLCFLLTRYHRGSVEGTVHPGDTGGLVLLVEDPDRLAALHRDGHRVAAALGGAPDGHNHRLRSRARQLDCPVVALQDSWFIRPAEHRLHRLLRAVAGRCRLDQVRDQVPANRFLPDPGLFARRFSLWPETLKAARELARECSGFQGPEFGLVLPPYRDHTAGQAAATLRRAALAGARKRYGHPLPERVLQRLNHELSVIDQMGFSSYFLVVRDIVRPVSRTCGRGSGAASLVAYCLEITNVCPLTHNLYFERFLNPGRRDAPDIDIDFAWDERGRVLSQVLERYGDRAAMVCSMIGFRPRNALREVCRVMGLPAAEIKTMARHLELETGRRSPENQDTLETPWPEVLSLARQLVGRPRHISVHPGGVVITPGPLCGYVPVQSSGQGLPVVQWDKDGVETAGLVKIDLLGNRSLGVIRDALAQVPESAVPRPWRPEDDPVTGRMLAQGRTMGCFYIESPAMRLLQQRSGQGDFEHLVLHSSIIRPAANSLIREYLRRLHGGSWKHLHPLLAGVLDRTYGIMAYQEDVSRVAVLLGFSHEEADRLRKIMARKDNRKTIEIFRDRFFGCAARCGIDSDTAGKIWEMMRSFEGYSFCKPHSASYARVSFQSAWLKAHHPGPFMAAVISNQGGYYSTLAYVGEAMRLGLCILPPDVQESDWQWQGIAKKLRVGLMAVRGLGRETGERILAGRPFTSMLDFLHRVRPDEDEIRALVHSGALDTLEEAARPELLWMAAAWHHKRKNIHTLFPARIRPPSLPQPSPLERLRAEFRVLGFLCERHPVTLYDTVRSRLRTVRARDLEHHAGRRVRYLGWCISGKIISTRTGEAMEFLSFDDETGVVECTFFPRVFQRYRSLLLDGGPLVLEGMVEKDFGVCTLTVQRAWKPGRASSMG